MATKTKPQRKANDVNDLGITEDVLEQIRELAKGDLLGVHADSDTERWLAGEST